MSPTTHSRHRNSEHVMGRMIQALWGDTTHVSQLDETWASGTKTEFAITACMLSVKINITFWSNAQTSISYNPALCCTFYSYKYSGCIDTDADPMQLAPNGTHEEWFKSLLSKSTTTVWHADMTKHWWRSTSFLLSYGISLTDNKNPALVWLS